MFHLLCEYCGNIFKSLKKQCPKCTEKQLIRAFPKSLEKIDTYPKEEKKEIINDDQWFGSYD